MVSIYKQFVNSAGSERIVILQRDDGNFTYCLQLWEVDDWGQMGPDCGIYDSALTAETEAMIRVSWLSAIRQ
ncbi:hypothetical protein [Sphingopyxis fribergensis]